MNQVSGCPRGAGDWREGVSAWFAAKSRVLIS